MNIMLEKIQNHVTFFSVQYFLLSYTYFSFVHMCIKNEYDGVMKICDENELLFFNHTNMNDVVNE